MPPELLAPAVAAAGGLPDEELSGDGDGELQPATNKRATKERRNDQTDRE
jgi:hypothetical protein